MRRTYFILTQTPRVSLFPDACHHNTLCFKKNALKEIVFMSVKIKNVICCLYLAFLSFKAVNWKRLNKKNTFKVKYAKKVIRHQKGQQMENVTCQG